MRYIAVPQSPSPSFILNNEHQILYCIFSALWCSGLHDSIAMVLNYNSGLLGNVQNITNTLSKYDKLELEAIKVSVKKLYQVHPADMISNNRGNLDRGKVQGPYN